MFTHASPCSCRVLHEVVGDLSTTVSTLLYSLVRHVAGNHQRARQSDPRSDWKPTQTAVSAK